MEIAIFIIVPFLLALVAASGRIPRLAQTWILAGGMAVLFLWALSLYPQIDDGEALRESVEWVPSLNLTLSIYLDALSFIFVLLVTGIGAAVFLYSGYYFAEEEDWSRFQATLMAFSGAMLGLVLADNVLFLFIMWEGTSLLSFMLISFKGKKAEARAAGLQALMITGGGGLALIAGLIILGTAAGSFELSTIIQDESLAEHPWYNGFAILIFIGCFTKSAQWPVHFWLPGGMTAPSPASAFLHSATMVKAGIYLLARLYPSLGNTTVWEATLMFFGFTTLFLGALFALWKRDLKATLAYSTISQLGAFVALAGMPDYIGYKALLVGVIGHALYKSTLFLMAGYVDHSEGTRIIDMLGGLRQKLPAAAGITAMACLSMAGVFPLLGFVAKETLLAAVVDLEESLIIDEVQLFMLIVTVISATFTVTVAWILAYDVYFRPKREAEHSEDDHHEDGHHDDGHHEGEHHHVNNGMLIGPGILTTAGLVLGLLLEPVIVPLLEVAVPKEFELPLIPKINLAFWMSMLALTLGTVIFFGQRLWIAQKMPWDFVPDGERIYRATVGGVEWFGDQLLKTQNGKLRIYLVVILGAFAIIMATPGLGYLEDTEFVIDWRGPADLLGAAFLFLAIAGAVASIIFKNHLVAILAMGVVGYAVGGVFLLLPSPDVALVQFLVETLGTVLAILMLSKISIGQRRQAMDKLWDMRRAGIIRDIVISGAIGVGVGVFALAAVLNRPDRESEVSQWYVDNVEESLAVTDVVAGVITDFRGTDTLVEIIVFSMAALGVLTVLTIAREEAAQKAAEEGEDEEMDTTSIGIPIINTNLTRVMALLILPFALLIAFAHLFYAGSAPGDGFTAGVVGGIGIALWYVVFGYEETRKRLDWLKAWRFVAAGITLALANALFALFTDRAFFEIIKISSIEAPAGLHFASSVLFEIGIFLTIFGSISIIMESIAHPEEIEKI